MSKVLKNNRGKLFRPTFVRGKSSNSYLKENNSSPVVFDEFFNNTNLESTSSFRYGDKTNLVSTQQVKIDWSRFENHTFFHSAVANVNEAFDRIINFYPVGGDKKEIEAYEDGLTGFEKYVLDSFPKNVGYLNFSGSGTVNNGNYIEVIDSAGSYIQSISRNQSGNSSLNPINSPFSFEFFIKLPTQANDNQIIAQKSESIAKHFTLALSSSSDTTSASLYFAIASGSLSNYVTGSVKKGEFVHIAAQYDKKQNGNLKLIINDELTKSQNDVNFGNLNLGTNSLFIGKGSNFRFGIGGGDIFTQQTSFSGSIDDFKFFHNLNTADYIKNNRHKTYFPNRNNDDLRLHYRFNEPYGSYEGNSIALDSGKFSLHSNISNFKVENRLTGSDVPITAEDLYRNPILFPTFPTVDTLNFNLLTTASLYDDYNPNLITKLIPHHYFQEATNFKDYQDELEALEAKFSTFSNGNIAKRVSDIPSIQLLIKMLLVYAKHFDEIKILIDAITNFNFTFYNENETTPDPLLLEKAKISNTVLPKILGYGNIEQIFEGIDLTDQKTKSAKTLNEIQNLVWRRILSDAPKNKKRKGTVDSIKSIFRSVGVEPDNILDFREYGGSKIRNLNASKETKKDVIKFLDFNFAKSNTASAFDAQGYPTNGQVPYLKSGYLYKARTQKEGVPLIAGTPSPAATDGLLTSGSFTYEGLYKWPSNYVVNEKESLIRMNITSSNYTQESLIANLVGNNDGLTLYLVDAGNVTTSKKLQLYLSGVNVFDGDIWNVSFGKKDKHDFETATSASFFIRAGKQSNGEILETHQTSSLYEQQLSNVSLFKTLNFGSQTNTSGSFLVIGSQSFPQTSPPPYFNKRGGVADAKITDFYGSIANIKFYSKNTTVDEWKARVRNYSSIGVSDPIKNYNFNTLGTGSFERIVVQTDTKQTTTGSSAAGRIKLFDFSQNNIHIEGYNFPANQNLMTPVRTQYEVLSDKFDINYAKNKIRIKSYQDIENINNSSEDAEFAPVSEIITSNESIDDNRLSLDMSVMRGLNRNILTIFSDLNSFGDYLGDPNLIFSDSYPELKFLRELYFNNLTEKVNLQKFREIFKWIDGSFTEAVYSVVPKNTNFLGINFIYESHVLERNRFKYKYDQIYLNSVERDEFIFDEEGLHALGAGETYEVPRSPVPPPTTETPIVPEANEPERVRTKNSFESVVTRF